MRETIPEDLKSKCTFCDGTGIKERVGYSSAGEMDAGGEPRKILRTCEACKGKTWVWALDEQEMAERIAAAEARNKVLEEALRNMLTIAEHCAPVPGHEGSCGPESLCDCQCADAANCAGMLRTARAALREDR